MLRSRRSLPFAMSATLTGILAASLVGTTPAEAQVRYTTVSSTELGGAMGRTMSMMPGMDTEVRETTWISGSKMRTDSESQSTIVDLAEGRFTTLDHEAKTWWTMTFQDLEASVEAMQAEASEGMEDASVAGSRTDAGDASTPDAGTGEAPQGRLDITVSTDRTGQTRTIGGYETERVFVTIRMDAEGSPTAASGENPEMERGTMVLLNELWVTAEPLTDVMSEVDMSDFRQLGTSGMEGMGMIFQQDPNMELAFHQSEAAMEDLGGTALESTAFWIALAPDAELDREAILAQREGSLAGDAAGAAAGGAKDAAADAVKSAGRRLGGILGRGGNDQEPEDEAEEAPPTQATFLRLTTRLKDLERAPIPASTFEVPADYTEQPMPGAGPAG